MDHGGFVGAAGEKDYFVGVVEDWEGEADAVGLEFLYPVGDDEL